MEGCDRLIGCGRRSATLVETGVAAACRRAWYGEDTWVEEGSRWWHLPDYIEVAAKLPATKPLIGSQTADLLRLVKNFRNLIHPGAAKRLSKKCDRSTALTALAGIVAVVNELG